MTNTLSKFDYKLETIYPSSDGQPMAESTEHYQWIVTITGGLESLFKDDENVFVAGDLLWYPVEGQSQICRAPDAMVVFGRPKGARGSYIQHLESGIAPQVVFEILSVGNRMLEMSRKFNFYEAYGVKEYYVYDHLSNDLAIWFRDNTEQKLESIEQVQNWQSPCLGISLELTDESLNIFNPDGSKFLTYLEQVEQKEKALSAMSKYAAKLREMGIDPDSL